MNAHRWSLPSLVLLLVLVVASCASDSMSGSGGAGGGSGSARVPASARSGTATPPTLKMAILRAQQKAAGRDFLPDAAGVLRSRAGSDGAAAEVAATGRGVRLTRTDDGGLELGVETASVGRDGARRSLGVLRRHAEGQELVLDREDDVEERFLAGPLGLEHSYLVQRKPEGEGPLVVEVAFTGLTPEMADEATERVLLADDEGRVRGGYRDLVVADADGREIGAHMEVRGAGVALVVDDVSARYPLRVDPVVWTQQAELTASDGTAWDDFGMSVAVSGGIALVGAPYHDVGTNYDQGAAYAFVQSGTTWTQQAELMASNGAANDHFGSSVAVSGGTAVVGAHGANASRGAAYVFVQSGTTWTQQAELTASDGAANDCFGLSVAVSGSAALVGAPYRQVGPNANQGAAYVFVQSGTTWTQQASLTASDGAGDNFGWSVAVSGGTAIVGAPAHTVGTNASQGAAYVFVRSGTTWTQQASLTASDGAANDGFGRSVAVSGGTAIVGVPVHTVGTNASQGAAYVFVQSGTTWTQQAELTASDGAAGDWFGVSVAMSVGTAIVGTPYRAVGSNASQGAAYVFVQSGTTWTQQAELTASDGAAGDWFGWSAAVSGGTALVGAYAHQVGTNPFAGNPFQGAAYVFVPFSTNGTACAQDSACSSSHCVDGVCCDTACGGGIATDCQACSAAAGASTDGTCTLLSGTACDDGSACTQTDTCQAGVCTGGNPVACAAPDQCHDAGTCNPATGTCSYPNKANGTVCNDGNACTQADTCQAGVCIGSSPVACAAPDQCHDTGVCNPATGACSYTNKANGTACNDGSACTQSDTCQAGACTGSNPVTCAAPDQCHDAGPCNPATGACSYPNKADGTTCNDGNACTQVDACQAGVCTGSNPVACAAPDQCHDAGTCNPATGACSYPNKANGTVCSDGNACTQTDTCQAGVCTGSSPVPCAAPDQCHDAGTCNPATGACSHPNKANDTACSDGNACTQTDTCQAGVCTGSSPVTCAAPDQCHDPGACNPATGACSYTNKADGTACNDGSACTQADTCQAGVCTGSSPITCAAPDQCHDPGACNPATGACTYPNKADGTACDDGNACTSGDVCQSGLCAAGQAAVCAAIDACHEVGTCDPQTGNCSAPVKPDGAPCEGGTCAAGVCVSFEGGAGGGGTGGSGPADGGTDDGGTGGGPADGGVADSGTGGGSADSGTGGGADNGDAGANGGAGGFGTGTMSGSTSHVGTGGTSDEPGGCGCGVVGAPVSGVPWLGLGLLAALRRRRLARGTQCGDAHVASSGGADHGGPAAARGSRAGHAALAHRPARAYPRRGVLPG